MSRNEILLFFSSSKVNWMCGLMKRNGRISFLDTCLHLKEDGSTKVTVYWKPTHTDQYLNFHSNHHLQHKRAVVNTLLLRAQTLVSEEVDRVTEIQHVKQALKANNYPDWMLTLPNTASVSRVSKESVKERRIYASVPYIKGTSERLQRTFKSHEVTLVHKPFNSLRSQLVRVKDKTENLKKCGTVYHIHCEQRLRLCGRNWSVIRNSDKGTSFKEFVSC